MIDVFVEIVAGEAVVYRPGTPDVVKIKPTLEDALAFARAEWPDLGIRVIFPKDVHDLITRFPSLILRPPNGFEALTEFFYVIQGD